MACAARRATKVHEFVAHGAVVNCISIGRKSGKVVATAGEDKKINLWTVPRFNCVLRLTGHTTAVDTVKFHHNEDMLASGSNSGTVKLFDLEAAKVFRTLNGHKASTRCIDFHPYGDFVASGSSDHTIKLWDSRRRSCINTYRGHDQRVNAVRFSPDGRWIVSAADDGPVKLWDLAMGRMLVQFDAATVGGSGGGGSAGSGCPVHDVEFHPNEYLLAAAYDDGGVRFFDLETYALISTAPSQTDRSPPYHSASGGGPSLSAAHCARFHPDGEVIVVGGDDVMRVCSWEPIVQVFDRVTMGWGRVEDLMVGREVIVAASKSVTNVCIYLLDTNRLQAFAACGPLLGPAAGRSDCAGSATCVESAPLATPAYRNGAELIAGGEQFNSSQTSTGTSRTAAAVKGTVGASAVGVGGRQPVSTAAVAFRRSSPLGSNPRRSFNTKARGKLDVAYKRELNSSEASDNSYDSYEPSSTDDVCIMEASSYNEIFHPSKELSRSPPRDPSFSTSASSMLSAAATSASGSGNLGSHLASATLHPNSNSSGSSTMVSSHCSSSSSSSSASSSGGLFRLPPIRDTASTAGSASQPPVVLARSPPRVDPLVSRNLQSSDCLKSITAGDRHLPTSSSSFSSSSSSSASSSTTAAAGAASFSASSASSSSAMLSSTLSTPATAFSARAADSSGAPQRSSVGGGLSPPFSVLPSAVTAAVTTAAMGTGSTTLATATSAGSSLADLVTGFGSHRTGFGHRSAMSGASGSSISSASYAAGFSSSSSNLGCSQSPAGVSGGATSGLPAALGSGGNGSSGIGVGGSGVGLSMRSSYSLGNLRETSVGSQQHSSSPHHQPLLPHTAHHHHQHHPHHNQNHHMQHHGGSLSSSSSTLSSASDNNNNHNSGNSSSTIVSSNNMSGHSSHNSAITSGNSSYIGNGNNAHGISGGHSRKSGTTTATPASSGASDLPPMTSLAISEPTTPVKAIKSNFLPRRPTEKTSSEQSLVSIVKPVMSVKAAAVVHPEVVSSLSYPEKNNNAGGYSDAPGNSNSSGFNLNDFLPAHVQSVARNPRSAAPLSEGEALDKIGSGHNEMIVAMMHRQNGLRQVHARWSPRDPRPSVEVALALRDSSVLVDLLNVLNMRASLWSLDLCAMLLPAMHDLIQSKYEPQMATAISAIKLVLKNFGSTIKDTVAGPRSVGVDLSREERHSKCTGCHEALVTIRSFLLKRQTMQGKVGSQFRELLTLMEMLD